MRTDQGECEPEAIDRLDAATFAGEAAFGFIARSRNELLRWLFSGMVVLTAYAAVAAVFIHWHEFAEADDPAAALVIELAPMPVAPTNVQSDVQPEPEHEEVPPERPVEQVEEPELKPEIVPDVKPDIVIPQPMPLSDESRVVY